MPRAERRKRRKDVLGALLVLACALAVLAACVIAPPVAAKLPRARVQRNTIAEGPRGGARGTTVATIE